MQKMMKNKEKRRYREIICVYIEISAHIGARGHENMFDGHVNL